MSLPPHFLDELRSRTALSALIGRTVKVTKAGREHKACCPFHNEKTPSFTINDEKGFYHCFGCGAHGDAIRWMTDQRGLPFMDAVKELAAGAGMDVPAADPRAAARAERANSLHDVMTAAADWFTEQLGSIAGEDARRYLTGRGLKTGTVKAFGIGYAPDSRGKLRSALARFGDPALIEAGLLISVDDKEPYDRFRGRLMIPIRDPRGRVIAFGGRILGEGEPKYLNSPETALFQKGQELYGLFQARNAIRNTGRVLVVEGYMDVVALVQHGIEYAVATLGTATTPVHVQKLLRAADEIIFCFDGDKAGRRAAWRAVENSLGALTDTARLLFLFLPEGEDPDSYVRQVGKEAFEISYSNALTLSQFLFKEITRDINLTTDEGRAKLVQTAKPLIEKISAPTLQLMLRKRLAELTGLSTAELTSLLPQASAAPTRAPKVKARRAPSLSRQLLRMVLLRPDLAREAAMEPLDEQNVEAQALRDVLNLIAQQAHINTHAAILEALRGEPVETLLAEVAGEALAWDEAFDVAQEFNGALAQVRAQARQKRIDHLLGLAKIQALSPEQKQALTLELAGGRAS